MSAWAYITGTIVVEIDQLTKDPELYVKEKLKNAPLITGSERDAQIIITTREGFNHWSGCDCEHCEYKDTIKYNDNTPNEFSCDADADYVCSKGEYQTKVVITIVGELRDRYREQTSEEFKRFVRFLSSKKHGCGFDIVNKSVKIKQWCL